MRSKTGIAPRLASTRDVSGSYANSPYPQWMKSLEVKYQKLHTKIMQSTSVSSVRQLSGPRSKRSEASVSRLSNRTRNSIPFRRSVCKSSVDIGFGGTGAGVNEVDDFGDDDSDDDILKETMKPDPCVPRRDTVPEVKLWRDRSEVAKTADDILKACGARTCRVVDNTTSINSQIKNVGQATNVAQSMDALLPTPRNINTSVSRVSNKTSRSCPAVIQTANDFPRPSGVRPSRLPRPTKRKNLKVFSRMSLEAQHAINETLNEMGAENSSLKPVAPCETMNKGQTLTDTDQSDVAIGMLSTCEVEDGSLDSARSCASSSTVTELMDSRNRRGLGGDKCLLPQISQRSNMLPKSSSVETLDNAEAMRIPGVGKYNLVKRERTFQITFGDFDIRYRDIISCDRRGSETPPAEIREKAIAKCTQWLEKYTPR
ncbi:uncharacterized protein [Haliotis asinina]|uniref:uncharacterized protein n=1 Tax=Haliotis asinina TaxID=109174 RepID=UPI0035318026